MEAILHAAFAEVAALIHAEPEVRRVRLSTFQPRAADYGRLFRGRAAELARRAYERLWDAGPTLDVPAVGHHLTVWGARARDLDDVVLDQFPGGYREVTPQLLPDPIWICGELRPPSDEDGITFDGLVHLEDRWVWCPKPWLVLPGRREETLLHWTE